jgi:hypothetical protein
VRRRTSAGHGRGAEEKARVSPGRVAGGKLRSIAVVVCPEPRPPKAKAKSPPSRRPPEAKAESPLPRPPKPKVESPPPRRTPKPLAKAPTPQPVSAQGSGQKSSERAPGSRGLLPYARASQRRMVAVKRMLLERGDWSCFTGYVLASWERAGRGLPCRRWTPEIREVALRGSPAERDVYERIAAQRANGIWEDAWDLHVWAQRLPPLHPLRDLARVALWALKGSTPPGEEWPLLDLDWAVGVETKGKMTPPSNVIAARVGVLLLQVWQALAGEVPVLEYAYTSQECHRLPTRALREAMEAVGVLWEGDIIVRESSDERSVALRDRCSTLWAPLGRDE